MRLPFQYSIFLVLVLLFGCVSGATVITGTVRTPIEINDVKIYAEPPQKYEVIAIVDAFGSALTIQQTYKQEIEELKKRAAEVGANGLLITTTTGGLPGAPKFSGKAIYVPKE